MIKRKKKMSPVLDNGTRNIYKYNVEVFKWENYQTPGTKIKRTEPIRIDLTFGSF